MIRRFGIDTSVLVRLLAGEPEEDFGHCVRGLRTLIEDEDAEVLASNQVIGEACVAVQHHCGVPGTMRAPLRSTCCIADWPLH